jgi:hypothetical protein
VLSADRVTERIPMDMLAELILAPDREHCPGARGVLSLHGDEPTSFRRAAERICTAQFDLARRGQWHGEFLEFEPALAGLPRSRIKPSAAAFQQRWSAARPIVLPGALLPLVQRETAAIAESLEWHREASAEPESQSLLHWLASIRDDWSLTASRAPLADPERDIERVEAVALSSRRSPRLWLKSGWLSTHPDDASLRVRVSAGVEGRDDAAPDLALNREVAQLAARALPCAAALREERHLQSWIEALTGEPLLFTQDIAYWNAPEGGALFHHDAFAPDGTLGQLGVCYAQLSGETFWLAISTEDLCQRIVEFTQMLEEGELAWVRQQLFPEPARWRKHQARISDPAGLRRELALQGQGELGALLNRGPEFTAFLADAGHGWLLRAGDVILLPNHGLDSTCMHSVFCASEETTYALSLAIRSNRDG